jgi:hypothetical protein
LENVAMMRRRPRPWFWSLLVLAGGTAQVLLAIDVVRGPAIGRPDDASVSVSWTTDAASSSRVDYSCGEGPWSSVRDAAALTHHTVLLHGLPPAASCRYRAFSDDVPLGEESTFRAPRAPFDQRFQFAVVGDTAGGVTPAAIAARLAAAEPDFAIHTGDVVYPVGAESVYDQEFFRPFAAWLQRGPVLPTLGNHDALTNRGAPLLANFVLPKNDATGDSRFYAIRQGIVLFVCLDVETSPFGAGSPQYEWLARTLAGTDAAWKIVYFHEPPFSSDHSNLVARLVLSPVLERYGVDVVFNGHAHLYERTVPIRMYAPGGPGILYVTEGGGGAVLSTVERIPESAFVEARFSYVLADVDGGRLLLSAYGLDGVVFDNVALEKTIAPAPPRAVALPNRSRPRTGVSKESR